MIRHLLKLVWHRKRANALVMLEIFFSFLVVFAVATGAIALASGWRRPLGFAWDNVWLVSVGDNPFDRPGTADDPIRETMARALREVQALPQVESAGLSALPPFENATSEGEFGIDGKRVHVTRDEVDDGFGRVLRIPMLRGRWFDRTDDALAYQPVVIDADLARDMYGDQDPVGRKFEENDQMVSRVVGVIPSFRRSGEFSAPGVNMVFYRKTLTRPNGPVPRNLVIRVRQGTPAEFEAELTRHLHSVIPDVSFEIRRFEHMRDSANRERATPLAVGGIVALFLVSMVALGLTGVLWQDVTRRTRELGLRRAVGASGMSVRKQILGEVALLSTLAVILGIAIVAQLPLIGAFAIFPPPVFAAGAITALAVIYGITLLSGLYPSWLASRLEPADALRYE